MIVCHCNGIREPEIRRLVRRGKATPEHVARHSGAGAGCGGCRPTVAQIIACEQRRMAAEATEPAAGFASSVDRLG